MLSYKLNCMLVFHVCEMPQFGILVMSGHKYTSTVDGTNTDGSFTMANSNSFLSPYEILQITQLPITQENKYLRKFSYFIVKLYVVCTH